MPRPLLEMLPSGMSGGRGVQTPAPLLPRYDGAWARKKGEQELPSCVTLVQQCYQLYGASLRETVSA
jgi:hypothetical protein